MKIIVLIFFLLKVVFNFFIIVYIKWLITNIVWTSISQSKKKNVETVMKNTETLIVFLIILKFKKFLSMQLKN